MKRFKRISIVLSIFILLIWSFISAMIIHPMNHIRPTDDDIEQTKVILVNNGITVSDEILSKKAISLHCPTVHYRAQNREELVDNILGENVIQKNETSYMAKNTELQFTDDNRIRITGVWDGFENITIENVAGKATKLIKALDLNKTDISVHAYPKNDDFYIVFVPEYKNRSVYNCLIEMTVKSDSSYVIDALPVEFSKPTSKILSQMGCEALSELILSGSTYQTQISGAVLGYTADGNTLKPAWKITTNDGKTFYVE